MGRSNFLITNDNLGGVFEQPSLFKYDRESIHLTHY